MELKLAGKKALVTGSTSGIGFAVAKCLAQEGAEVILNGRSQARINEAKEKLLKDIPDAQVSGIPADFAQISETEEFLKQLPPIDILINNVGIFIGKGLFETSDEEWYRQFEINVMSGMRLSRHVLPAMLKENWGRIIFVSSECATLVPPEFFAYSLTKTALLALSRGLAQMSKGTGVTVNSVLPGSTLTEGAEEFLQGLAEKENKTREQAETDFFVDLRPTSLIQRFISVEEVASTITYLASPLAAATNGASIKIDGGSTGGLL